MTYTQQTNEALAAGFSLSEIREQAKREADEAIQAGFTADEVYEGIKTEYGFSLKDDPADLEAAQDFAEVATVDPVLAEKADMHSLQRLARYSRKSLICCDDSPADSLEVIA